RPVLLRLHFEVDGKPSAAVLDVWVKELFAFLDRNGDGVLDEAEAARAPRPEGQLQRRQQGGGFPNGAVQTGALSDADLTGEGLAPERPTAATGMARTGAPPASFFMAAGKLDLAQQILSRYDQDQNKKLSPEEAGLDGPLFKRLDANGDGFLDVSELARLVG